MLNTFVRLTLTITLAVVALVIALFVLKLVLIAAVVAALVIGGMFVVNFFRRERTALPVPTQR